MTQKLNLLLASLLLLLLTATAAPAQDVKVIKFEDLKALRKNPADTLYVVNFWATWCKPCIKELPYFEAANQKYKNQPVKVILVSMDAVEDVDTRVRAFMQKRGLKSEVVLLDEVDGNSWIDKLEPKWSGAIPATMVFNNKRGRYEFREAEMTEAELMALIEKHK
ncbi:TlpA disulfide reductase family protein [Pontibacter anaerobius]|uniref:TlpA disulfide reductase family protein n=1 Tax=Pontibacter anaerobius TaxID=2993940 RepID=A0ABT3RIQ3_9BACT|nr:TlpA disulfide reductase family protein [Pontibacter anaerobius]MCX2741238.1 TlpA disulfide reductase family protein [Pontibacter anaerobius]